MSGIEITEKDLYNILSCAIGDDGKEHCIYPNVVCNVFNKSMANDILKQIAQDYQFIVRDKTQNIWHLTPKGRDFLARH